MLRQLVYLDYSCIFREKVIAFILLSVPICLALGVVNGSAGPSIIDPNFSAELVTDGLESPTSMAFVDSNKILVLEKNTGEVRVVSDGVLLDKPVIKLDVDHTTLTCCRGLLGIAVADINSEVVTTNKIVFLYFSEALSDDSVRNRVYKYKWDGETLINPTLILDLPATPGPNHPGGKLAIGKDGYLYTVIGDLNNEGLLQNLQNSNELSDTSVVMRISSLDGSAPVDNPFFGVASTENARKYYGYGVRNSFGLAVDPITGALWDTENGDKDYDEINLVSPGFNSGWKKLMGPISESHISRNELVNFPNSNYVDPAFSFYPSLGLTGIEFFNSSNFGEKYQSNIFVGDINNGNLYFFKLNSFRNGLEFEPAETELQDLVANGDKELSEIAFGTNFGGITDIKTGPDGLLYVLTFDQEAEGKGKIYRIVRN
jgi:glucose/arabinose dehydrogenase